MIAGRIVDKDGNPIKDYTSDNNGRGTVSRAIAVACLGRDLAAIDSLPHMTSCEVPKAVSDWLTRDCDFNARTT